MRTLITLWALSLAALSAHPAWAQECPRLRVLTYNIHHGEGVDGRFDYERLARIIRAQRPDLVALQEVDRRTRRASGVDQAAELAQRTRMHVAFGNALYYSGGEYGEAVLSRFPIENPRAHHLPFRPGQEPRTALEVRVKPGRGLPALRFVGTHLCHQSEATRVEQAQQLNLLFEARGGAPVVLAGDLNARPGSAPMKALLAERWRDASAPQSVIDYVLVRRSDAWRVVEVKTVDERVASDHKPVLVVLEWTGAAAKGGDDGGAPVTARSASPHRKGALPWSEETDGARVSRRSASSPENSP
jgi:endonuclease/exonuclease/phosphatase family metal-dependent hydrolase